jgi:carbon monoxide dehydrogenase subunit G
VRFADGPTIEVDAHIDAPPARVWPFVTDVAVPAEFSSEFQGGEWIEPSSGAALGAKFRGRNALDGVGEWETTSEVIECDEPHAFAWAVGDPSNASATWRFTLTPDGDATKLSYFVEMGPGPSGLTAAIERIPDKEERIIERRVQQHRANMMATLEGIKRLAESG